MRIEGLRLFIGSLVLTCLGAGASPIPNLPEICLDASVFSARFAVDKELCPNIKPLIYDTPYAEEIVKGFSKFPVCSANHNHSALSQLPWVLMSSNRQVIQMAGYLLQLSIAESFLANPGGNRPPVDTHIPRIEKKIKDYLLAASHIRYQQAPPTESLEDSTANVDRIYQSAMAIPEFAEGQAKIKLVCALYGSLECTHHLQLLSNFMNPRQYQLDFLKIGYSGNVDLKSAKAPFLFSLQPVAESVFFDPSYSQGAAIAAIKIMTKIEDARQGRSVSGNLFSDLVSSYIEAGLAQQQAEKNAWGLLALYGVRGPAVDWLSALAATEFSATTMTALYVITAGSPILDSFTTKTGHQYSYPSNIKSNCHYGKSYHFWLSAFLAHWLRGQGAKPQAAALAVHLMGMGYEFAAKTPGRDREKFFQERLDSPYNNSIRMNLAFNDAGAVFGAHWSSGELLSSREFSIDDGILAIIESSKPDPGKGLKGFFVDLFSNTNEGSRFLRWRTFYAPDAAYELFGK